jgi:hypothetical protein
MRDTYVTTLLHSWVFIQSHLPTQVHRAWFVAGMLAHAGFPEAAETLRRDYGATFYDSLTRVTKRPGWANLVRAQALVWAASDEARVDLAKSFAWISWKIGRHNRRDIAEWLENHCVSPEEPGLIAEIAAINLLRRKKCVCDLVGGGGATSPRGKSSSLPRAGTTELSTPGC